MPNAILAALALALLAACSTGEPPILREVVPQSAAPAS
jgi:hypothetical protein